MKKNIMYILSVLTVFVVLSSCTARLVDYTVISSKNVGINFDKTAGVQVEGSAHYPFGIGLELKTALDRALEEAGPEYDILVDGVVEVSSYYAILYLWNIVTVKGTAVSSKTLKVSLGEGGFNKWLLGNKITYNKTDGVVDAELPKAW